MSTTASVSREKHKVSAFTCLFKASLSSKDKVVSMSHCARHTAKSLQLDNGAHGTSQLLEGKFFFIKSENFRRVFEG